VHKDSAQCAKGAGRGEFKRGLIFHNEMIMCLKF